MFDAARYLRDRRVRSATSGKDVSRGWVAIKCPFCDDPEMHGGFSPEGWYNCWRCGHHKAEEVVMALDCVGWKEARDAVVEYGTGGSFRTRPASTGRPSAVPWPPGALPLQDPHKRYLASRGFDPEFLEVKYGLRGTGPAGRYAWRVVAPVVLGGVMVSYQGRDITGRSELRYKACRNELEAVHHKHLLYNIDRVRRGAAVVVEGIFDVWRLGDGAVATMGTATTPQQLSLAAARLRRAFVLFDAEAEAQRRARKLVGDLALLGVEASVAKLKIEKGDPADMAQGDADRLMEDLLWEER